MITTNSALEVVSIMTTIELALMFNSHRNKNSIVRSTCNKLKHKASPELKCILHNWSKSISPFQAYSAFMDEAGL